MDIATLFDSIHPRYPEFQDQVALITGSGRGIGKGIALRLAREGMKIVIHGLDEGEVSQTTQELQSLGVEAIGIAADFSQEDEVHRLFDVMVSHFDRLDVLVNNAADLRRGTLPNTPMSMVNHQLAVNIGAPFLCSQKAVEIMEPHQRGNIINISSVGGLRAHWRGLPYDVTKGALDSLTQVMAIELGDKGIRVNAVAPGAIPPDDFFRRTDINHDDIKQRIPIPRFGTTLDIAAAVAFLASEDASYITGQILYVDGGITTQLAPRTSPI